MGHQKGAFAMAAPMKYPPELRQRAVAAYRAADPKPVIRQMARDLGVHHEALRNWIRQESPPPPTTAGAARFTSRARADATTRS
ncbi:transposase [Kitasatospora sp. NPDC048545]|uniref:transposase n=1 Tax=Kitasatospora sp. NPDC048545 TaxID=3157208 RepID=UPI0034003648